MLIIRPDSIFKQTSDKKLESLQPEELILYLNEEVVLENITFARMFELILNNHSFFDVVFYRALGGFRISDFEEDFYDEPEITDFNNVNYLSIAWATDLYRTDDNITNLSLGLDIAGKNNQDLDVGYSITLSSINEYKHLPLVVDTAFSIYDNNSTDPILNVNRNMTLYDVIKVILYEITFYGNPNSRNVFKDEIVKISDGLDLNESVHTLSFDDLFQNVKDNLDSDIKPV